MNKTPQKNRFWYLFGPFLLYWGIEFFAAMLAGLILVLISVPKIMDSVTWRESMTNDEITAAVSQIQSVLMEEAVHYQVQMLTLAALCTIPVMAFLFHRDRQREVMLHLPVNKKAPLYKYIWIVILGAAFCIGGNGLIVMSRLAFASQNYQNASAVFYDPPFWIQVICLGIIIPISEELIFRGLLFKRCRDFMGFLPAALCISILFGFNHGNLVQFLYAAGLGMFLAYTYEKYGSIRASVLLHITANLTSLIITETGTLNWLCGSFGRMAISIVVCAFLAAVSFVVIQKIEEKPDLPQVPGGFGESREEPEI